MDYLYLIPLLIGIGIGALSLGAERVVEREMITPPFKNPWANEFYMLSYQAPFKWFVNPDEKTPQIEDLKRIITEANESHRLNYRSYMTIQVGLLMLAVIIWCFASILIDYSGPTLQLLFNIATDVDGSAQSGQLKLIVGVVLCVGALAPKYYLKTKANRNKYYFIKDLPILQLFIILMLKARRPLAEVLYVLSTTNTVYRQIFDAGYRIYIRDKGDGIQYLQDAFSGTKFVDTIQVLENYGEYSKDETITVLENGLVDITNHTNTLKRRKDISANVFSQLSLAFPFLAALLLCFGPVVAYGLNMMNY